MLGHAGSAAQTLAVAVATSSLPRGKDGFGVRQRRGPPPVSFSARPSRVNKGKLVFLSCFDLCRQQLDWDTFGWPAG
jgi:hypothetical protein